METITIPKSFFVEVGILDSAPHYTDPDTGKPGATVASVAASHVYGKGVPKRDFFAAAAGELVELNKSLLKNLIAKLSKSPQSRAEHLSEYQMRLGVGATNIVRKTIDLFSIPPNSEATIAKKGRDDPLVDTGLLMNTISWKASK